MTTKLTALALALRDIAADMDNTGTVEIASGRFGFLAVEIHDASPALLAKLAPESATRGTYRPGPGGVCKHPFTTTRWRDENAGVSWCIYQRPTAE